MARGRTRAGRDSMYSPLPARRAAPARTWRSITRRRGCGTSHSAEFQAESAGARALLQSRSRPLAGQPAVCAGSAARSGAMGGWRSSRLEPAHTWPCGRAPFVHPLHGPLAPRATPAPASLVAQPPGKRQRRGSTMGARGGWGRGGAWRGAAGCVRGGRGITLLAPLPLALQPRSRHMSCATRARASCWPRCERAMRVRACAPQGAGTPASAA